jgi:hypothetical protein
VKKGMPHWLVAVGLALLLAVPSQPAEQAKKPSQPTAAGTQELVWPLPPGVPRVRWVAPGLAAQNLALGRPDH